MLSSSPAPRLGRYTLLRSLGAGGMAELFLARADGIEGFAKELVIKRLREEFSVRPGVVRMFLDEARLSLRLNHANVVSVFDIGESENTYFIVMELITGRNLREVLRHCGATTGPMPVPIA